MRIDRLDHLVLTVADIDATVAFYRDVLGMAPVVFGGGRTALNFGRSKINLHQVGKEFEPKAAHPVAGSADLCLIADDRSTTSSPSSPPIGWSSRRARSSAPARSVACAACTSGTPTRT